MRVNIQDFQAKYGSLIPDDIMALFTECFLQGVEETDIRNTAIDEIQSQKAKQDLWNKEYEEISSYRIDGMQYESQGDIEQAISSYKKCIAIGENSHSDLFHAYAHAYKRIIILLHKMKDFKCEIAYINAALAHNLSEKDRDKYVKRLNKLKKIEL